MKMNNVVLMASGTGTNAINLLNYSKKLQYTKVVGIIVDKKESKLLSQKLDVPVIYIPKYKNISVEEFEQRIVNKIQELEGNWVLLCGFMRVLGSTFLSAFTEKKSNRSRVINIHPSLLPKYKGMNGFKDAFISGDKEAGITLHYVNEELDAGEIFLQQKFLREDTDTFDSFVAKGKKVEWELYPKFLDWLENGESEAYLEFLKSKI